MNRIEQTITPFEVAYEGIMALINNQTFKPNDQLPAERELCAMLSVSRTTLRRALEQLRAKHVIESLHGSGNYVCAQHPTLIIERADGFSASVEACGEKPTSKVIFQDLVSADAKLAYRFKVPVGTPLFCLIRIRLLSGKPAMYEKSYTNPQIIEDVQSHNYERESLFTCIYGQVARKNTSSYSKFTVARLTQEEAGYLGVEQNTLVFCNSSTLKSKSGDVLEHCKSLTLPNCIRYVSQWVHND
ncbi:MAG: GntR family transcriptional regulator [Atopobium sp.]|uniref:GntR family transcriptional regulator n=1 Tax=Atopobium sp. TaxID=1872650 RepID=UPI002A74E355|nr:GntR family transcriptional regulator [Atopobium sp.]MDY2788034.1 GntR family transcriptional regulator [Atopobium sp.]